MTTSGIVIELQCVSAGGLSLTFNLRECHLDETAV